MTARDLSQIIDDVLAGPRDLSQIIEDSLARLDLPGGVEDLPHQLDDGGERTGEFLPGHRVVSVDAPGLTLELAGNAVNLSVDFLCLRCHGGSLSSVAGTPKVRRGGGDEAAAAPFSGGAV